MFGALPTRPSVFIPDNSNIEIVEAEQYSDARTHGYQGSTRFVSIHNATSVGGGSISMGPDRVRCVVAGRESLRILRVSEPSSSYTIHEHKFSIGKGGHQIEMSKNLWTGSGLKAESALTDVAWGQQIYDQKLVTSSRNGELILWDLNKAGPVKYERRIRDHTRSINKLSYSRIHPYLCITGSADGDLRVWDLRHMQKSAMYIRHPDVIRTLVVSPCLSYSSQAITALDNGSVYRWDIRVGSKGLVDRIPVAHSGAILGMDWSNVDGTPGGWLATAGLDRSIWDMSAGIDPQPPTLSPNSSHSTMKASHTLHTQFPIRRVLWRPDYQTELAISSFHEFGTGAISSSAAPISLTDSHLNNSFGIIDVIGNTISTPEDIYSNIKAKDIYHVKGSGSKAFGEAIEIWDVRRAWIAKWTVEGSTSEGGVSDMIFSDSHALWATRPSGAFSQMDLRFAEKPVESIPRVALCWDSTNSLVHVTDVPRQWETPYDDIDVTVGNVHDDFFFKNRGDPPCFPNSQAIGSSSFCATHEEKHSFAFLAENYRVEGTSRSDICGKNALAAFDVYRPDAGNVWLLLQSLLLDIPTAQQKMQARPGPKRTISGFQSLSSRISQTKSISGRTLSHTEKKQTNHEQLTNLDDMKLPSFQSDTLPSQDVTRSTTNSIQSLSFNSADFKTHRFSLPHSPISSLIINDDSNADVNKPGASSRDLGDRTTDDSDSSDGSQNSPEHAHRPYKSLLGSGPLSLSQSAPHRTISASDDVQRKCDDRLWSDREGNISVSLNSSDEEFDESVVTLLRPAKAFSKGLQSRKGTGDALFMHQSLSRHESNSSMRTVTAGNNLGLFETCIDKFQIEKQVIGSRQTSRVHSPISRDQAHILTDSSNEPQRRNIFCAADSAGRQVTAFSIADIRFFENSSISNREDGERYLENGWQELRQELRKFIRSGDLQMSAMLSCIASKELHLKRWETARFVEAYIEQLCQLRLYVAAAYLRKYYNSPEISHSTQIQTTLHTVCSKCYMSTPKLSSQQGNNTIRSHSSGGYLCSKCRTPLVKCSICHLPVKALLFVCPVCAHGGHQDCYRRYYMKRPMTRLTTIPAVRGRKIAKEMSNPGVVDADSGTPNVPNTLAGHPCAAGCGHFCWAASGVLVS